MAHPVLLSLTVQFADLSTKIESPASRSWKWEYKNATVDWTQFAQHCPVSFL